MDKRIPAVIKKFDIVFVAALLMLSLILVIFRPGNTELNKVYRIKVVGVPERTKVFQEPSPKPVKIKGLKGISIVEWNAEGKIRIASSPCPMHICTSMGWIGANNSVVCIPNGVIVECIASDGLQLDGISR